MKLRQFQILFSVMLVLAMLLGACATAATEEPVATEAPAAEEPTAPPAEPTAVPEEPAPATEEPVVETEEPAPAAEPVEITFWHAMSGSREEIINGIAERFNAANPGIVVKPEYTGSYAETVTKGLAAYRTGTAPTIVQSYEVGTRTMYDSGAIVPVHTLNTGDVDWEEVVTPIRKYYTLEGELPCMPFNSSTAMIYYNKDMFTAAGLDPDVVPVTWDDIESMSQTIMDAGLAEGGFSMGWPAWIFEQMFAYHDQLLANNDNGRSAIASEVYLNSEFGVKMMTEWQRMADEGVLVYGGREYAANDPFLAGQFPFLIQSTSSLGGILSNATFEVGTAFLPRLSDDYPQGNSVVGGACLWVFDSATPEQQAAAWEFFKFTFSVDEAITWHKGTGYFPTSISAYEQLKTEGWFEEEPNHATAFDQILGGADTPASNGVILGDFVTIRDIVGAAIEDVVVNGVDPKEALDKATADTNQVLEDYISLLP
jgi:sn-glycerol 3-phosphate transport system substrate-binding protein